MKTQISFASALQAAPLVIGHRGAAALVPENTLPSFRRAWALGVFAVELDVHLVDGRLLVIHDDTLERTTNGRGPLAGLSLDRLRALDAGGGAPIPFLDEVVAELPDGTGINIELKGVHTAAPVAAFIHGHALDNVLVSSFDHAELGRFRHLSPGTPVAPLFGRPTRDPWSVAVALGACAINLSRRAASRKILAEAGRRGLASFVYTVNDLAEARRLVAAGATGVFTDDPERINRAALSDPAPA